MELTEIRNWTQFVVLTIGGLVGLTAFFQNMKQRKIENALKMTAWFNSSVDETDLLSWENLFRRSSEPAGAEPGFYTTLEGAQQPLSDYFSEGSPDSGSVGRIADSLNVICHEILEGTVDARFVWFELGQLLGTVHSWLGNIHGYSDTTTLLADAYPAIDGAFKKFKKDFNRWPSRTYAYVE